MHAKSFSEKPSATLAFSTDWCHGLPEGLKELTLLEGLFFHTHSKLWSIVQPLAELLPMDNLQSLTVGGDTKFRMYRSKRCGGEGFPEHLDFDRS